MNYIFHLLSADAAVPPIVDSDSFPVVAIIAAAAAIAGCFTIFRRKK